MIPNKHKKKTKEIENKIVIYAQNVYIWMKDTHAIYTCVFNLNKVDPLLTALHHEIHRMKIFRKNDCNSHTHTNTKYTHFQKSISQKQTNLQ